VKCEMSTADRLIGRLDHIHGNSIRFYEKLFAHNPRHLACLAASALDSWPLKAPMEKMRCFQATVQCIIIHTTSHPCLRNLWCLAALPTSGCSPPSFPSHTDEDRSFGLNTIKMMVVGPRGLAGLRRQHGQIDYPYSTSSHSRVSRRTPHA
jgi:hypothetical protein